MSFILEMSKNETSNNTLIELQSKLLKLKESSKLLIKDQHTPKDNADQLILLTDEEIEFILNKIPNPPSRYPHILDIHNRHKDIIKSSLKKAKCLPNSVELLAEKFRERFLRGWIFAGTSYGLTVSDDLGASSMQGALNTRHKAGMRQNASGGIKSQREIVFLHERSYPTVIIVFKERQTFKSIMEYWRPKLVGIKLTDLIYSIAEDIEIQEKTDVDWYNNFIDMIDDRIVSYQYTHKLVLKIRKDRLFAFKISLNDLKNRLEFLIPPKNPNQFSVLYNSVLSDSVVEIHIIPNDKIFEKSQHGVDTIGLKSLSILNSWRDDILNATISGKEGIYAIVPIAKRLLDGVIESFDDGYYRLTFNSLYLRFYGATLNMLVELLTTCGYDKKNIIVTDEYIKVLPKDFDPNIYLSYLIDSSSNVPFKGKYNKKLKKWVLSVPKNFDNDSTLKAIIAILESETSANFNYSLSKNLRGKDVLVLNNTPKITVLTDLKKIVRFHIDKRVLLEEKKRTERNNGETNDSLIVKIDKEEALSELYIAEVSGGTMMNFASEPGIDIARSYSNNAKEINRLLGICATRKFLTIEIDEIWSNSGSALQAQSILTTADSMTYRGSLTPSSHIGITSNNIGFLSKSTVSAATKWLSNAALNKEVDRIQSASAALITGKRMKMGTGIVKLRNTYNPPLAEDNEDYLGIEQNTIEELEYTNIEDEIEENIIV